MRNITRARLPFVLLVAGAAAVGCAGRTTEEPAAPVAMARATLHRAQSCDDLSRMLKDDALAKMNARIDQEIAWIRQGGWGWAAPADASFGAETPSAGDSAGAGSASGGSERATTHSETNTQVPGVDEADLVKTDGKLLYVLHGNAFFVLDAWPAASLAVAAELAIEGEPIEMYVEGDRAVVYSRVDGNPVFQAAGVAPRASYVDYGYAWGTAGVGVGRTDPGGAVTQPAPAPDDPAPPTGGTGGASSSGAGAGGGSGAADQGGAPYPGTAYLPLTKITVIRLDGTQPSVVAEHWFEGDYLSSRRTGTKVRTVLNGGAHGPAIPWGPSFDGATAPTTVDGWVAAWEAVREQSRAIIEAAQPTDWMPWQFRRDGASIVASSPACDQFYVPTSETTEYGLVQLESLDWTAPETVTGVDVVGRAETIYASPTSLYVAASAWNDAYVGVDVANAGGAPVLAAGARTHLHRFDLATTPDQPQYVGSGTVPGALLDQFSLDEKDGRLRVATTEDRVWVYPGGSPIGVDVGGGDVPVSPPPTSGSGSSSTADAGSASSTPAGAPPSRRPADVATPSVPLRVSRVFVLASNGDSLDVVGQTPEIAPDERLYATRFVGDRAYLVTFEQVDPLFAIDLADPTQPTVRGQLTIPGFSEYMHPIDDAHLLTIGKQTEQDSGGSVHTTGVAVQLFDVSDIGAPKRLHLFTYDDPAGSSTAAWDHKAFTWYPAQKMLAFPYSTWTANGQRSSLELLSVDVTAGIAQVGSIDHSPLFAHAPQGGWCGGYYGTEVRRGVFLDDVVYSVSYAGVVASDLKSLAQPVASVALPEPQSGVAVCGGGVDGGPLPD